MMGLLDTIAPTPRNRFLGLLADAAQGVSDFAARPFGYDNPPGAIVASLLGVPAVANTLNEMSYGGALGTGSGMTWKPKADTLDAAMAVAPFIPKAAQLANTAAASVGKAVAPYVDKAVPAIMERGGLPAQFLQDMAYGSRSNLGPQIEAARGNLTGRIETSRGPITLSASSNANAPTIGGDFAGVSFSPSNSYSMYNLSESVRNSLPQPEALEIAQKLTQESNRLSLNKREYLNLIEAQRAIDQPTQYAQPSWVDNIINRSSSHADAPWWENALKDKAAKSYESFADAARGSPLMLYSDADLEKIQRDVVGNDLIFSGKNGKLSVMNYESSNPVIRSIDAGSQGKRNGGGKELYQAANKWVADNDKVVGPDIGLSDINQLRKLGNALSAQVRAGKPVVEMNSGGLLGVQSTPDIWRAEAKLSTKRAPEVKTLKFDGQSFNMTDGDIVDMLSKNDPEFSRGVGLMTAKRAALSKFLENASPAAAKAAAAALIAAGSGAVFAKD